MDARHLAPERAKNEIDGLGMLNSDDDAEDEYEDHAEVGVAVELVTSASRRPNNRSRR